ncbi:hypothetical protein B0J11DRAFT_513108 [Dendryphion nanum]|uniref:Uncharacterized protein n=1 Tax=Dendryphion nanum TaxID=256645 RepID=A0A9P9I6S2_9PLEO|nr:hypothetical protein B0J11DRAFT_513108 [Dendryphion nanum]
MAAQQQQAGPTFESHNDFRHYYVQRLYTLDSVMCIVMAISRKILRQTELDFLQFVASYEEKQQKNAQLSASNDSLRCNLDRAHHAINTLESQLYAGDSSDSCSRSCCNESSELNETLRLVEQLESDIVQLEESKLRMQVEHEQDMNNVIQAYEGVVSEARVGPVQEKTESIELDVKSNR